MNKKVETINKEIEKDLSQVKLNANVPKKRYLQRKNQNN